MKPITIQVGVSIQINPKQEDPEIEVSVGEVGFQMPSEDEINDELDPDEEEEDDEDRAPRWIAAR